MHAALAFRVTHLSPVPCLSCTLIRTHTHARALQLKWSHIGRPYFLLTETLVVLVLGLFMLGHVGYQSDCTFLPVRLVVTLFGAIGLFAQVCF